MTGIVLKKQLRGKLRLRVCITFENSPNTPTAYLTRGYVNMKKSLNALIKYFW